MSRVVTTPGPNADKDRGDQLFWLSRLDESRPRASINADNARGTSDFREYDEIRFSLDPDVVRSLKSVDPTLGVSDVALCATVLSIVLANYQREDELIAGRVSFDANGPNVVPVILPCDGESTFATLVKKVDAELQAVGQRSAGVLAQMRQVLRSGTATLGAPLLELAFSVETEGNFVDARSLGFDVTMVFEVASGRIGGRVIYSRNLFRRERMQALARHIERAAGAAARQPNVALKNLQIFSNEEIWQVVHHFNERSARFPLGVTIHGLFELQSSKTPDAIAAIHNGMQLSYRELNERANQIANSLLAHGLGPGGFVGILLPRGIDFLAAILGVMKAGGAYIPLDPTYPEDRIRYMLADSEAALVISSSDLIRTYADSLGAAGSGRTLISVAGEAQLPPGLEGQVGFEASKDLAGRPTVHDGPTLKGLDRAYMIYTSGSTGHPKGAICHHDGALNHLFGELDGIGIHSAFRFLQTAASSSDISVWQFLAPVLFGGATVIVDYETVVDPALLFDILKRERIDLAEPVPVVLRGLLDHVETLAPEQRTLPNLRCMMVTGEALPVDLVNRWLRLYPDIPVANTYGPTETSDDVTQHLIREPLASSTITVPIGAPLPNVCIFILDRYMRAVPAGVPGEICVAGIAVGEGYWKQPAKTEAAFVPSAYPDKAAGRMYRTGDLGRWLPDGAVEFLGRIDQQVKVRGFRVEPGEIEAVMTAHPAVQDAAVVAIDGGSGLRLTGYYVVRSGQELPASDLRQHLKATLADHMIPAALVPLHALPMTPMGKIDRRALARTDFRPAQDKKRHVAPRTSTEISLAEIWATVLGRESVSADDNFFEAGGDSILTMRVVAALRKAGISIAPRLLFQYPGLADLARAIDSMPLAQPAAVAAGAALPQAVESEGTAQLKEVLAESYPTLADVYPLCGTQRGIYYQSLLLRRNSGAYVEQVSFDLEGDLDPAVFSAAWDHVTRDTVVLRTAIVRRRTPQPVQVVVNDCRFPLQVEDYRSLSPSEQDIKFDAAQTADRMRGYDLAKPPLTRGLLVRLGESHWRFLWSYHHLILDGWSEPLVLGDVMQAYDALASGAAVPNSGQASYRSFVDWSESQPQEAAEKYWRSQLSGFVLPVSIIDPSPAITPPSPSELMHAWVDADVATAELRRFDDACRFHHVTFGTLVHGAWALLLHNRCASDDVMFGSVASGRQAEVTGIESIRGLVVVTQPLRVLISPEASYSSWLRLLQLQMAEMREHEHTPLASIQQWSDVPVEKRPLFDSLVVVGNYENVDLMSSPAGGLRRSRVRYATQPLYPLTLFVVGGHDPSIRVVYDRRRYAAPTARDLASEFLHYLRGFVENPEQRLAGLCESAALGRSRR